MQSVGREEPFKCYPVLQLSQVKGLYLSTGWQFLKLFQYVNFPLLLVLLAFIIFPDRKKYFLLLEFFMIYGYPILISTFQRRNVCCHFYSKCSSSVNAFLLTTSSIQAVSLGQRNTHVFIGQQGKIRIKIPRNFLFAVGSCEWQSLKENLYHEFGAVLFICCKKLKTNVLTLLADVKIRAVSSSLCWFRLNQMGFCNNYQLVCLEKVRMPGLKERKVKEEKVFL